MNRLDDVTPVEILQCESCNKQCNILHNCIKVVSTNSSPLFELAPHSLFDEYDGVVYCNECAIENEEYIE